MSRMNLEAPLESQPEIASFSQPLWVLFYFFKNVHVPILLPIYREMTRRRSYRIAFALHPYNRAIRAGFEPQEEAELRRMPVEFVDRPQQFSPDVTLMADNVAQVLDGCGKLVNVGHGLLSKGQYFTDSPQVERENLEDLLCVPGEYHRKRILDSGKVFIPVVATGFPKLDAVFQASKRPREELFGIAGLDPAKRTVLYAPTFNMELSAIPILWTGIRRIADESTYLLIKLHGSTPSEFKRIHRSLASEHPNIRYIEDADIGPHMAMADVMVSDVSSAFMEFIALDKPVVLFDNPNITEYRNYDPRDIEYSWRDVGIRAATLDEVIRGVRRSLADPGEFSDRRRFYAGPLLADREGNAAANVVTAIEELLRGKMDRQNREFFNSKSAKVSS